MKTTIKYVVIYTYKMLAHFPFEKLLAYGYIFYAESVRGGYQKICKNPNFYCFNI